MDPETASYLGFSMPSKGTGKNMSKFQRSVYSLFYSWSMIGCTVLVFIGYILSLNATSMGQVTKGEGVVELTNSIGMKLVLIPKGTFTMGSPETEVGRDEFGGDHDETQHTVTISRDFYLGITEVTQGQYEKVMGSNPSRFQGPDAAWQLGRKGEFVDTTNYPVEFVNWYDAVAFCTKLSELPEELAAGRQYRLPTEAEWEYACRAGSTSKYSFGDDVDMLGQYAWFTVDPEEYENMAILHEVARLRPNAFGLFDMHGNVAEWCNDWAGRYSTDPVTDPSGPSDGQSKVFRGGSFGDLAWGDIRSAARGGLTPTFNSQLTGLRVALDAPREKK